MDGTHVESDHGLRQGFRRMQILRFERHRLGDRRRRKRSEPAPDAAEWATDIRDQCEKHDVAFFFKQWGGRNKKAAGRELEGAYYDTFPKPKKRRRVAVG